MKAGFWEMYHEAMLFMFDLHYSQQGTVDVLQRKYTESLPADVNHAVQRAADEIADIRKQYAVDNPAPLR